MRQQGRLTEWNDDRGFGFITPLDGGSNVFAHISAFPHDKRRPIATDLLTYEIGHDEQGRARATNVDFLAPTPTIAKPAPQQRAPKRRSPGILIVLAGLFVVALLLVPFIGRTQTSEAPTGGQVSSASSDDAIANAFNNQRSGLQVTGSGVVERILDDDVDGGRHQRFILRLDSGQTLLVAHNIDIAPRISSLQVGDVVEFNGVYEWNAEGGVIHWTHHDPDGQHVPGSLVHEGSTYQ